VRKGQASFEFLLVTALAISILLASTYFIFSYTQSNAERTAMTQSAQIGYQIVDQARNVFIFGEGSFVTVQSNTPEQMVAIYTTDNRTLVIELETTRGIIPIQVFSDVDIRGVNVVGDRTLVNSDLQQVRPGRTSYRIESRGSWVEISQR